jgi:hypothetical protein
MCDEGPPLPPLLRSREVVERRLVEHCPGICYVMSSANSDFIVTKIGRITAALRLRMLELDAASKFDARVEFEGLTVGLPDRELAG